MATDMRNPLIKGKSQDVEDISLENLDDLLAQLSQAELEELNGDFDPDNSLLPPSQRQRDQTDKEPTGPFNKKHLLEFLEKQAKEEKDWDTKPFTKETRGKVFVPKEVEEEKLRLGADEDGVETEWDDILQQASEEELVDLAAVLGFHSMLTQVQYHASLQDEAISNHGGFKAAAKAEALKIIPNEPPNPTDVEETLEKLKNNDSKLVNVNLNNIKNISLERLIELSEALATNSHLKVLHMANTGFTDKAAKVLAQSLEQNKTLRVLNLESNYITGDNILALVQAINNNKTVVELRVANQKPSILGNRVEMAISKAIAENDNILRFGIFFEFPDARIRVHEKLKANNDLLRKERLGKAKGT
ncbi:tropomodulin-1-like [Liolophura sinensis]|uniref:tropomodulin-1-like n=1 Tax=Liolophura sinensis TaxID=3198878 RepID=UPI00315939EC